MSYILDALRKAERDRGIEKVPALLAVHDLRPAARNPLWVALAGTVLLGAAVGGWLLFYMHTRPANIGDQAVARQNSASAVPHSGAPTESKPVAAVVSTMPESPTPTLHAPSRPVTAQEHGTAQRAVETPRSSPLPVQAGTREAAQTAPAVASPGASALEPRPAAGAPPATGANQAPSAAPGKPLSVREAVAGMSMTVLVYAEGKPERLVFIDGRKYVEGDLVNDTYLLESIRPDGAVLSYAGERAVLRPGGR